MIDFKRSRLRRIQIVKIICLLVTVGILCISPKITANAATLRNITERSGDADNLDTSTDILDSLLDSSTDNTGLDNANDELNTGTNFTISVNNGNGSLNSNLRILIFLTLIALAPTLILMLTSFTRIIIVLHFTRAALSTNTAPPNQVLIGLALILTLFIMTPTFREINETAIKPFEAGEMQQDEFFKTAVQPLRNFMYTQTQSSDVKVFMEISGQEWDGSLDGIPLSVLIPSFMVGELRIAFQIGFLIYIPFIIIDMVVASTLMSMGMMMLPPTTISMPFKILLFVLADGWNLIIVNLVKTFY